MEVYEQHRFGVVALNKLVEDALTAQHESDVERWLECERSYAAIREELEQVRAQLAKPARIYTRCPSCHYNTLSIHEGRLFCTYIGCKDPTLIHRDSELEQVRARLAEVESHAGDIENDLAEIQKRADAATGETYKANAERLALVSESIPALIRVIAKLREQRDEAIAAMFGTKHSMALREDSDAELLAELTRKDT